MLNNVERGRLFIEPAGKYAVPMLVGLLDVELNERAGQLFFLPRRRRFASTQTNDDVLPANRLAGMKSNVLNDSIALVEDAEHGDPLRHWRYAALPVCSRTDLVRPRRSSVLLAIALAARDKRKRGEQGCRCQSHAYSGIQGS